MPDVRLRIVGESRSAVQAVRDLRGELRKLQEEHRDSSQHSVASSKAWERESASVSKLGKSYDQAGAHVSAFGQKHERAFASMDHDKDRVHGMINAIDMLNVGLGGLGTKGVVSLMKLPAAFAAIGTAAQGVGALSGGIISLSAALAPAAGATVGYATVLGSLAQGMGVVKLATSGISEALGGNEEALKKLTPQARQFVKELKGMKPELDKLKVASQEGLFPGLEKALQRITSGGLMKTLQTGLKQTGQTIGGLADQMAKLVSSRGFSRDLGAIMSTNNKFIQGAGEGLIKMVSGLRNILVAAQPLSKWFGQLAKDFGTWFENYTKVGRESGRTEKFFERTKSVLTSLGHIVRDFGAGLLNIFRQATPAGEKLLGSLEGAAKQFREFTEAPGKAQEFRKFFNDQIPVLKELGGLVKDIVVDIAKMSQGNQFQGLVQAIRSLLPLFTQISQQAAQSFGPVLINTLKELAKTFLLLAGPNGPLTITVQAIGGIAHAINAVLQAFPGLRGILFSIAGAAAIIRAFKFTAMLTGLGGVAKLLQGQPALWSRAAAASTESTNIQEANLRRLQAVQTGGAARGMGTRGAVPVAVPFGPVGGVAQMGQAEGAARKLQGTMARLTGSITTAKAGMGLFGAAVVSQLIPGVDKATHGIANLTATGTVMGLMFGPTGALVGGLAGFTAGLFKATTEGKGFFDKVGDWVGKTTVFGGALRLVGIDIGGAADKFKDFSAAVNNMGKQTATAISAFAQHKQAVAALTDAIIRHNAALDSLKAVQEAIRTGALKGAEADHALLAAKVEVTRASKNLADAHQAVAESSKRAASEEKNLANEILKVGAQAGGQGAGGIHAFLHKIDQMGAAIGNTNPLLKKQIDAIRDLVIITGKIPSKKAMTMILNTEGKAEFDAVMKQIREAAAIQARYHGRISFEMAINISRTGAGVTPSQRGRREGGTASGLIAVSPGEELVYPGGQSVIVPGLPEPRDSVAAEVPVGTAVLTGHGRFLKSMGMSIADIIRNQLPHFAGGGRVLSPKQIAGYARGAGIPGNKLQVATAIALGESGGDTRNVSGPNPGGSYDYGLWQINNYYEKQWFKQGASKLFDPAYNARAMAAISRHGQTWRPWVAYTNNRYRQFMDEARAGVANIPGATVTGTGGRSARTVTTARFSTAPLISRRGAYLRGFMSGYTGERDSGFLTDVLGAVGVKRDTRTIPGKPEEASASTATARGAIRQPSGLYWPTVPHGSIVGVPYEGSHDPKGRFHNWESNKAIDISVPVGSRIIAVASGVLGGYSPGSRSDSDPTEGDSVHLRTRNDEYWYEHMFNVLRKSGAIKAGQLIGLSGKGAGVPHLHFGQKNRRPFGYRVGGIVGRMLGRFQGGGYAYPTGGALHQTVYGAQPLTGTLGRIDTGSISEQAVKQVEAAMKALVRQLGEMSVAAMRRMQARIIARIHNLQQGDESAAEEREIKRLQGAVRLIDNALGRKLGTMVRQMEQGAARIAAQADEQAATRQRQYDMAVALGARDQRDPIGVQIEEDIKTQAVLEQIATERMQVVRRLRAALERARDAHAPQKVINQLEGELKAALEASSQATIDLVNAQVTAAQNIAQAVDEANQRVLDQAQANLDLVSVAGGNIGAAFDQVIQAQMQILQTARDRLAKLMMDTIPDNLQAAAIGAATTAVINAESALASSTHQAAAAVAAAASDIARAGHAATRAGPGVSGPTALDIANARRGLYQSLAEMPAGIQQFLAESVLHVGRIPMTEAGFTDQMADALSTWLINDAQQRGGFLDQWSQANSQVGGLATAAATYGDVIHEATVAQQNNTTAVDGGTGSFDDFSGSIDSGSGSFDTSTGAVFDNAGAFDTNTGAVSSNTDAVVELTDAQQRAASQASTMIGRIASRIDTAFDKVTQAGIDAISAPLNALRAQQAGTSLSRSLEDAQAALELAERFGDPAMIKEAQRQIDDIALQQQINDLEASTNTAVEAYQAQREAQREVLDDQIADLNEALAEGHLSYANWLTSVNDLLAQQGIPAMANMGTLMGEGFAQALLYELDKLQNDIAVRFGGVVTPGPGGVPGSGPGATTTGGSGTPGSTTTITGAIQPTYPDWMAGSGTYPQPLMPPGTFTQPDLTKTTTPYTGGFPTYQHGGGPTRRGLAFLHENEYVLPAPAMAAVTRAMRILGSLGVPGATAAMHGLRWPGWIQRGRMSRSPRMAAGDPFSTPTRTPLVEAVTESVETLSRSVAAMSAAMANGGGTGDVYVNVEGSMIREREVYEIARKYELNFKRANARGV